MWTVPGNPCPVPVLPDSVLPVEGEFTEGDTVELRCKEGYQTHQPIVVICKSDLTWSLPIATCRREYIYLKIFNFQRHLLLIYGG